MNKATRNVRHHSKLQHTHNGSTRRYEKGIKNNEEIMAENFANFMKNIILHIQ